MLIDVDDKVMIYGRRLDAVMCKRLLGLGLRRRGDQSGGIDLGDECEDGVKRPGRKGWTDRHSMCGTI